MTSGGSLNPGTEPSPCPDCKTMVPCHKCGPKLLREFLDWAKADERAER